MLLPPYAPLFSSWDPMRNSLSVLYIIIGYANENHGVRNGYLNVLSDALRASIYEWCESDGLIVKGTPMLHSWVLGASLGLQGQECCELA